MNQFTSQQRKLAYSVGIVLLMVPIIMIGAPGGQAASDARAPKDEGKFEYNLSRLRKTYELGETTLGDIDPSSATMNLVLVGLRGFAANQLWMQAQHNKDIKNWAQLKANINSIILLQPHFVKVWEFQSWNLSYNVSAEWDLVEDQYYWIKEGAKFAIRGTDTNKKSAQLFWWTGIILGEKISNHDAWRFMRKFFNPQAYLNDSDFAGTPGVDRTPGEIKNLKRKKRFLGDPDIKQATGKIEADKELNPKNIDNYLAAKKWFEDANRVDEEKPQRRISRVAFRARPARTQMAYAEMLQKEGRFDKEEIIVKAWADGLKEWKQFGQFSFESFSGKVRLDATDAELTEILKNEPDRRLFNPQTKEQRSVVLADKIAARESIRDHVNYNYWKTRATVEMQPQTVRAHREIYLGKQAYKRNDPGKAIRHLEAGLELFAKLMKKYPSLRTRDESVEEVIIAVLAWQASKRLIEPANPNDPLEDRTPRFDPPVVDVENDQRVPVLRKIWFDHKSKLENCRTLFKREIGQ